MWKRICCLLAVLSLATTGFESFAASFELINGSATNRLAVAWPGGSLGTGPGSIKAPCPDVGTEMTNLVDGVPVSTWDVANGHEVQVMLTEAGAVVVVDSTGTATKFFWLGIVTSVLFGLTTLAGRWVKLSVFGTAEEA